MTSICSSLLHVLSEQALRWCPDPFMHCCNSKLYSIIMRVQVYLSPSLLPSPKSYQEHFKKHTQVVFWCRTLGKHCLFKPYHRPIFFFSQSLSHLGRHFITHFLLECGCLIIYLIYKLVYHNLRKDFSTSKGAKSLDVSIITSLKKKKKWHKGFLCG